MLKTKAAAKKELLGAFGEEGGLCVPERIARLRREMREEYARANDRAWEANVERERKEAGKGKGRASAKRKAVGQEDTEADIGNTSASASVAAPPKRRKRTAVKSSTSGAVASAQKQGPEVVRSSSNNQVGTVSSSNALHQPTPTLFSRTAPLPPPRY